MSYCNQLFILMLLILVADLLWSLLRRGQSISAVADLHREDHGEV